MKLLCVFVFTSHLRLAFRLSANKCDPFQMTKQLAFENISFLFGINFCFVHQTLNVLFCDYEN